MYLFPPTPTIHPPFCQGVSKNTISKELQSAIYKRRIIFLEHLNQKRNDSRMDVYMKALKEYSGKQIYDLDDQDVLDYLLFKDSNKSGRTVVHFKACPFIGTASLENCSDARCSLRHTANSMRIGIVLKLRKAFEEVGRRGPYEPSTTVGDPTKSVLIQEYITYKQLEQGLSGVKKREAPTMSREKMNKLMRNMKLHVRGSRGIIKLRLAERRAMYAFCFTAIKRLAGAGHVLSANTIRMPNNKGLVFNCTWDKTLRMDSHCFGFFCMLGVEEWCAHCIIDEWVNLAKSFGITFNAGLLFPRLEYDGTVKLGKRWRANDITDSLVRDLKRYFLYEEETPHSFRHGGTVDSLRKGASLETTMYLAYMKSKSTAQHYAKGLRHLFPTNFHWKEAGIDIETSDVKELARQMHSWKAFSNENIPL